MSGMRNAFNCSFMACRSALRKCWHFILCYRPYIFSTEDQYQVLCLGLYGAGKSTLLAQLVGENTANIVPTNGFNIKTLPVNGIVLNIKELGGSDRVQNFWSNYYDGRHALMFVVNIADTDVTFRQSIDTLRQILLNTSLRGRPCLVIGTHKDMPDARTQQQLETQLKSILSGHKWHLVCCSSFDKRAITDAITTLATLVASVYPSQRQRSNSDY